MEAIFKVYGSAIGPALAFLLGLLALYIKHHVDIRLERSRTLSSFNELKKLVKENRPPSRFWHQKSTSESEEHQKDSEIKPISQEELRNLRNLTSFYNKLLASQSRIETIEEDIFRIGDIDMIRQFINIKWWHGFLFREVEEAREKGEIDHIIYSNLVGYYENICTACDDPKQLFDYVE